MPEYLSPGIYIQEVNSGPRPIEGVGTAMAAFVGFAPAGPVNTPTLVTNWSQYVETFGAVEEGGRRNPHLAGAYLSHCVYGYFLNGGGRCMVTRVVPKGADGDKAPTALLPGKAKGTALSIAAKGAPTQEIVIEVAPATEEGAPEGTFTLKVKMGDTVETYDNVTTAKKGGRNVVEAVNAASRLVTATEVAGGMPNLGSYSIKPVEKSTKLPAVQTTHFVGDVGERTGLEGMEISDDVTMLLCPDIMAAYQQGILDKDGVKAVQTAMIAHCERMGNRMAIIDPLPGLSPQEVKKWRERDTNYDSAYATLYYPWISIDGPDGKPMEVPPCGHVAGVWARSDTERGVHKAPANEVVRGALNPAVQVTKGEQDLLNPVGVNCIRSFVGRGIRIWGARTLSSDPAWRYVNVRRLFNYVEASIERGTQWVVFEPNDPDLWSRVKRDVGAFLTGVWRDGALFGLTPDEAFFVKCDGENNPADTRDRGLLFIDIGLAPVKPAEFVVFRFRQFAGGGQ